MIDVEVQAKVKVVNGTGKILFGAKNQDGFTTKFGVKKDVGQETAGDHESIVIGTVDEKN